MIEFSGWFVYGVTFGFMLFDEEDNASAGSEWGLVVYMGPVAFNIVKYSFSSN
jgi:hypothetical protein